ncbi:hypothetical protein QBC32DRAFT_378673 [Pseudoneurospora amorphoporcata]|uniref:Ankyrin repeat protein n=1 Tax=Pseudoneurospora amorphoporcata TaxID=241081 RepID=A0AAN6NSJ3_9PEZI|nr:hypothetical protein QBC32DRAFT_378673 [Pseudoneurospora amorphoporcata]
MGCFDSAPKIASDILPQTQDALSREPHFCFFVGTPDLLERRSKEKASNIVTFKEQQQQQNSSSSSSSSSKVLVLLDGFDKTRTFSPDVKDTLGVEFHWRDPTSDMSFVSPPRYYFVFDLCESSRQRFLPSLMSLLGLALGPQTVPSPPDFVKYQDFLAVVNAIDADPMGKGDVAASFASLASELQLPPHLSPLHPGADSAVIREFLLVLADRTVWSKYGSINSSARKQFLELVKMLASSGGPPPPPPEANNNNSSSSTTTRPDVPWSIIWYRDWMPNSWGSERPAPLDVELTLIRSRWRSPRLFGLLLLGTGHEMQPLKTILDAFKEVGYLDTQEGKVETLVELVHGQGRLTSQSGRSRPREVGLVVEAIRYALALSLSPRSGSGSGFVDDNSTTTTTSTSTTTTTTPTTTTTTPPPSLRDALTKVDRLKILPAAASQEGNKELLAWLLDDADKQGGNLREALNTANYVRGPSPTDRWDTVWLRKGYVLHTAVRNGDVDMIKLLLERGAKMLRDDEGRTPLVLVRDVLGINYPGRKEKLEVLEGWLRERGLDSEYWDEPEEYDLDASEGEGAFEIPKGRL